jgi:hypothetical protein
MNTLAAVVLIIFGIFMVLIALIQISSEKLDWDLKALLDDPPPCNCGGLLDGHWYDCAIREWEMKKRRT